MVRKSNMKLTQLIFTLLSLLSTSGVTAAPHPKSVQVSARQECSCKSKSKSSLIFSTKKFSTNSLV